MIRVVDLHKRHGRLEVLKGIDLAVAAGEVCVVIGPSGGGKSTFLRCINGLEPFDAGEIHVGQHSLTADQTKKHASVFQEIRRDVGMVFQQFHLFPHLSALENVMEAPMQVLGHTRERAAADGRALLARVGLADRYDKRPSSLSGGQQQRVAIARALAMGPKVILFDEPTSALDPRMTAEVLAVMADLASSGQTMIVVTHAMSFARRAATNVHVFQGGVVLESGPPSQIFESPQKQATKEFLRETDG